MPTTVKCTVETSSTLIKLFRFEPQVVDIIQVRRYYCGTRFMTPFSLEE
jgi:hypothetical protein